MLGFLFCKKAFIVNWSYFFSFLNADILWKIFRIFISKFSRKLIFQVSSHEGAQPLCINIHQSECHRKICSLENNKLALSAFKSFSFHHLKAYESKLAWLLTKFLMNFKTNSPKIKVIQSISIFFYIKACFEPSRCPWWIPMINRWKHKFPFQNQFISYENQFYTSINKEVFKGRHSFMEYKHLNDIQK